MTMKIAHMNVHAIQVEGARELAAYMRSVSDKASKASSGDECEKMEEELQVEVSVLDNIDSILKL